MDRSDLQKSIGISRIIDIQIKKGLVFPHIQNHKTPLKLILVFLLLFLTISVLNTISLSRHEQVCLIKHTCS